MYDIKLSDIIQVNERFRNSINLQLDINKHDVIRSYIPTKSSVLILKRYLANIVEDKAEKSTMLIGPYGKGKSHLLIVLLAIISYGNTDDEKRLMEELIARIRNVDPETAEYIEKIRNNETRLLPVVISNTQMDVNQSFIVALNEALTNNNLNTLKPKTYFTEAIKVIDNWRVNYPSTYQELEKQLRNRKIKLSALCSDLEEYKSHALDLFKSIYPSLTSGSQFNPMINSEVLVLYKQINHELQNYGYTGMFIVFDEFSKYIEGHDRDTVSSDFKTIQEICELCNDSKGNQLHSLFVVHKSLKEYNRVLSRETINAFVGIEGRLTEILFVTTAQNNYELIQNAIGKKAEFYEKLSELNLSESLDSIKRLPIYSSLFLEKDLHEIIVEGCFPLTAIAAYLLLNVCELVAQNERTLFTFISKDEPHSLARFVREHTPGRPYCINADYIYDYFRASFRKEISNVYVHNEFLKAENAIAKLTSEEDIIFIKALAVVNITNKSDELPAYAENIALASGLSITKVHDIIEKLQAKQIIGVRSSSGYVYIKNINGANLESRIKKELTQLPDRIEYTKILQENRIAAYIQPQIHNQEKCINRYFEIMYYPFDALKEINEGRVFFQDSFSDGKIIYLVSWDKLDLSSCIQSIREISDPRLLFMIPQNTFDAKNRLRELYVVQKIKNELLNGHEERALIDEIKSMEEDLLLEIRKILKHVYMCDTEERKAIYFDGNQIRQVEIKSDKDLIHVISDMCDSCYNFTPVINNEMINKNVITSQIKSARSNLLQKVIDLQIDDTLLYSTSPEGSIYRSTLLYTGVAQNGMQLEDGLAHVVNEINTFIRGCEGKKQSFKNLYETIQSPPYGMRKGTIPIFLAISLCALQDTPVIYFNSKEVPFDNTILTNINDRPEEYYLYVEKGTKEKQDYLEDLKSLFEKYIVKYDRRNAMEQIANGMQKWMQSLPTISCTFAHSDAKILNDIEYSALVHLRSLLKRMDCNPRELLFERIPDMFQEQSFSECADHIKKIKHISDEYLAQMKKTVSDDVRNIFSKNSPESIATILKEWYADQSEKSKNTLLSSKITEFMSFVGEIDTFDELEIANKVSKIMLNLHVENWTRTMCEELKQELVLVKQQVESTEDSLELKNECQEVMFRDSNNKLVTRYYEAVTDDSACYFLKNALEDAMNEFGDSVEINQKVSILVQLISELTS